MPQTFKDPITIAGIPFNHGPEQNSIDADGVEWYCDQLDGWEDTTKPNIETMSFGYSDGVVMSGRSPLSARFIEFGGAVVAPTRELAVQAFRKLQGALDPNVFFTSVREGPIPEQMITRLADKVYKPKDIGTAFRFATTLIAPWPFKQSLVAKTGEAGVFTGSRYVRNYPRTYPLVYHPSIDNPTTIGTVMFTNLVTDPSFEMGLGSMTAGGGATLTSQATGGRTQPKYLRLVATAAATAFSITNITSGFIPVTAGQEYFFGFHVRGTVGRAVQARVTWIGGGSTIGASPTLTSTTDWSQRRTVSGVVPVGITQARLDVLVSPTSVAIGNLVEVDDAIFLLGTQADHESFDGTTSSPDNGITKYRWTGTPNASTTEEVVLTTTTTPSGPTSVDILNGGNADGYPIIEITGPLPLNSWYLVNDATGEQQSFALAIGSGQTLTINERTQVAMLEGQVVDYYLRGDWLYAPPGVVSTFRLVTTESYPDARVRVTGFDTWR